VWCIAYSGISDVVIFATPLIHLESGGTARWSNAIHRFLYTLNSELSLVANSEPSRAQFSQSSAILYPDRRRLRLHIMQLKHHDAQPAARKL
jgi:hypothetical protein